VGQQADGEGRQPHQADGDQERALAPALVADLAEHQRAERPGGEPDREGGERHDEARRLVQARIEDVRQDHGERAEDEEVVPLEGRARRGSGDDEAHVGRGDGLGWGAFGGGLDAHAGFLNAGPWCGAGHGVTTGVRKRRRAEGTSRGGRAAERQPESG
jgi:hypothetical protein